MDENPFVIEIAEPPIERTKLTTLDVLGPDGLLATHIPGYEHRPAQVNMGQLIEACIADGQDAIIEAGTGTGKSYGYLVPAILSGKQVIVSTANKTLQAQLVDKDLPALQRILPRSFGFCVAKGKANYICLAKRGAHTPMALARWIEQASSGDIDDAPKSVAPEVIARHVVGDVCRHYRCKYFGECFYQEAKRMRLQADVVVCNHALLVQYLALQGQGKFLPPASILIVDEAHQLETYAISAQSVDLSENAFQGPMVIFQEEGRKFLHTLAEDKLVGKVDDAAIPSRWGFPEGEDLADAILSTPPTGLLHPADELQSTFADMDEANTPKGDHEMPQEEHEAILARLANLAIRVRTLARPTERGWVRHIMRRNGRLVAEATRFDVSGLLGQVREMFQTVVYTSATIATTDFGYFIAHNGADPDAATLQVESPFDYRTQCLLYLPEAMPEPDYQNRDLYDEAARQQMVELVKVSRGGALLLFTSHYAMNQAADYLERCLSYPVRRQGDAGRAELIAWMKRRTDGVLCATASFWEGVDIPGESLRLVVIDKIPFAQPSPVERARQAELGSRGFMALSVPEAILHLKQGFGRLIRSRTDYGVVGILDPRLWLKGYGHKVLHALPDARVTRSMQDVAWFYEEHDAPEEPCSVIVDDLDPIMAGAW